MATSCNAAFKSKVLVECYDALTAAGFTRFRKENVDWPLESGFHCWVGLNNSLCPEYVEINPFIGLHVVPVMRFYTGIEGRKYDRGVATYSLHMGELLPDDAAFRFTGSTDVGAEAARLARLYATSGISFARSIASYEQLLPLLQRRVDILGGYPERTAACLYLMGKKDEARTFVESFLRQDHKYFASFAMPFLELLKREGYC